MRPLPVCGRFGRVDRFDAVWLREARGLRVDADAERVVRTRCFEALLMMADRGCDVLSPRALFFQLAFAVVLKTTSIATMDVAIKLNTFILHLLSAGFAGDGVQRAR